jgi:hypothetical protein
VKDTEENTEKCPRDLLGGIKAYVYQLGYGLHLPPHILLQRVPARPERAYGASEASASSSLSHISARPNSPII